MSWTGDPRIVIETANKLRYTGDTIPKLKVTFSVDGWADQQDVPFFVECRIDGQVPTGCQSVLAYSKNKITGAEYSASTAFYVPFIFVNNSEIELYARYIGTPLPVPTLYNVGRFSLTLSEI
jgi:hypothetical protein